MPNGYRFIAKHNRFTSLYAATKSYLFGLVIYNADQSTYHDDLGIPEGNTVFSLIEGPGAETGIIRRLEKNPSLEPHCGTRTVHPGPSI